MLICITGILFSCKEDEGVLKHHSHKDHSPKYKRSIVNFHDMKAKLSENSGESLALFNNVSSRGGEDYIQEIDTTYIIEYSNDTLSTYTLRVSTLDDDKYSYSNLIIRTFNNQTEEFIAHYIPTAEWQLSHDNGDYLPYDGQFDLTDTQGRIKTNCGFATEANRIPCTGSSTTCPCNDGNGYIDGYIIVALPCNPGEGTGPGNEDWNYGGGGSGGGSGSGNHGDLPTDPTEWKLLMLENALEDNPYLLLDIPCEQFHKWKAVIDYNFPNEVHQRITQLNNQIGYDGHDLQIMEFAEGPKVNMDFFPITISEFPINTLTGQRFTPAAFFDLMRKSLDSFLAGGPANFGAYNTLEYSKWVSSNYLTSLMRFDINVNEWISQDGSVICVEQHPQRWKFATIQTPQDFDHPVSGVREFGYYQVAGTNNYVFYTLGVDRVAEIEDYIAGEYGPLQSAFEGADDLWNTFQQNMVDFVNSPLYDGQATINADYIARPDWEQLRKVMYEGAPISSLPGFDNPCE